MARKAKQEAKPLPLPAKPRQRPALVKPALSKPQQQKQPTQPRQPRKRKVAKVDELMLWDKALDYLGNFLLLLFVSAIIVALAYFFRDVFDA
ncbi:MAG: hypothetical protein BWK73_46550 [Thiothrix lacustris]|uniref:Uncharacterized protein n=1 Tax=Thiothrix lacustris TaxID=525917 RepID=A0A1Y1QAB2_9GAMM|nr:MAG: hypothetical protein BWK73_46550 [Thiothrix lacustris]